jgi:hypothetical protein
VANFRELVTQICDHRANSALPVLQTAARLSCSGFEVSLDPTIQVSAPNGTVRGKVPDIKLKEPNTRDKIFVEVSRLLKSDHQNNSSNTFMTIWMLADSIRDMVPGGLTDILNPKLMPVFVRILRVLEKDELQTVVRQIRELAQEVLSTGEHRELQIEGTLELIISPPEDHSRAIDWAAARSMTGFVEAPLIELDEVRRIQGKSLKRRGNFLVIGRES